MTSDDKKHIYRGNQGDTGNPGPSGRQGNQGIPGEKGERGKSGYVVQILPYIAVFVLLVFSFSISEESRDQVCQVLESGHLTDVQALERTYGYLKTVDPADYNDPLNDAILRGLKTQEAKARTDQAPDFCDGNSIFYGEMGNPEPDPDIPVRPKSLRGIDQKIDDQNR